MPTTMTILGVDANAQIQRLLKRRLAAAGFKILPATGGSDALNLIATRAPDVVVPGLSLPDVDGKDVIRKVRGWSNVPITAYREFKAIGPHCSK